MGRKPITSSNNHVSVTASLFSNIIGRSCIKYSVNSGGLDCRACTFLQIYSDEAGAAMCVTINENSMGSDSDSVYLGGICTYFTYSTTSSHCIYCFTPTKTISGMSCDVCGNLDIRICISIYHQTKIEGMNVTRCNAAHGLIWNDFCNNFEMKFVHVEDSSTYLSYFIGMTESRNNDFQYVNLVGLHAKNNLINIQNKCIQKISNCCFASNSYSMYTVYIGSQSDVFGENNNFDNFSCNIACQNLKYQKSDFTICLVKVDKKLCDNEPSKIWKRTLHQNIIKVMFASCCI